jgi:hypothetical protein
MIVSGLRVFDIRDPEHPKEIAYHVAPPSTITVTGAPIIDERANYAMSQPAFAPERGEIWYSDGTSGFYALRMDPSVWPFPVSRGAGGCAERDGFAAVSARPRGRRVRVSFTRRAERPVRIDVLRASDGRRVARRSGPFTFRARRAGVYVVRFTMAGDRRVVVLARGADGRFRVRPPHRRRASCGLVRSFGLRGPVFGGTLTGSYRLGGPARVSLTVSRAGKVIKRFELDRRSFRFSLPGLRRGDYAVRLVARSGDDQVSAVVAARRV